jgi:hypothetical protein
VLAAPEWLAETALAWRRVLGWPGLALVAIVGVLVTAQLVAGPTVNSCELGGSVTAPDGRPAAGVGIGYVAVNQVGTTFVELARTDDRGGFHGVCPPAFPYEEDAVELFVVEGSRLADCYYSPGLELRSSGVQWMEIRLSAAEVSCP